MLMLSFSKSFHKNLNYASTANIEEVMKFFNPGYKTFETDFIRECVADHHSYYLARRSLCEIINSTLVCSFIDGLQIGGTLFRTCIRLKSKQRESGASQSPCFSQMRSEMRLCLFLQKEMR